jgi:hypothetical protein
MLDMSDSAATVAGDLNAYRPLLADRARRPAVVVILLAIIVITVLGMQYANRDTAGQLDRILDADIRTRIGPDQPITADLVSLGNPAQATILVAAVRRRAAGACRG